MWKFKIDQVKLMVFIIIYEEGTEKEALSLSFKISSLSDSFRQNEACFL